MQINQYPVTATIIKDEYLFDMDAEISVGVWQSQKVPWALINDSVSLKIGTTKVLSGVNDRILYQSSGVVSQSSKMTFNGSTFKLIGTDYVPTNNVFNMRTYTDDRNLVKINGLGKTDWGFDTSGLDMITIEPQQARIEQTAYGGLKIMSLSASEGYVGHGVGAYKFGIGANTPQARLDVRSQGALSSDLAFRVRNSANTQNSFQIDGLGQGKIKSTSYVPKFSVSYDWGGSERDAFIFTQNIQNFRGQAWTFDAGYNGSFEGLEISNDLTGNDKGQFTIQLNNFCFGTRMLSNDTGTAERRVLRIANGVAPTTSKVDEFKFYSADIVAGNASPHFRTENGAIIKLYQETTAIAGAAFVSGGAGSNIKTDDTFGGYTLQQIAAALKNIGILA